MTFLKKLGIVVGNIVGVAAGLGPIASAMFPSKAGEITKTVDSINQWAAIIGQVEVIGQAIGLKGPDKLKAAIPSIGQAIAMTDLVVTHKIKNQALYQQAVSELTQGTVDLLNSLDDGNVKSESVTA